MAKITKEQRSQIALLTRRANRRIERAAEKAPGQAAYLEHYVRSMVGTDKFSASTKNMTSIEAQRYIANLEQFLAHKTTTTRKGWEQIKLKGAKAAAAKFKREYGYNVPAEAIGTIGSYLDEKYGQLAEQAREQALSDKELADILKQLEQERKQQFYKAVNLVQASPHRADLEDEEIIEMIESKISAQKALEMGLKSRT